MAQQFGCRLSFNPDFARENARLVSEIEDAAEEILGDELMRIFERSPDRSLDVCKSDYNLHLVKNHQVIFLQIQIRLPRSRQLGKQSSYLHEQMMGRLHGKFRKLRGHLDIEIGWAPISAAA